MCVDFGNVFVGQLLNSLLGHRKLIFEQVSSIFALFVPVSPITV